MSGELLASGQPPEEALPELHRRFGGKANFGFLARDGNLLVYGGNPANAFWRFELEGAEVAATQVHSDDRSLFDLLFEEAGNTRQVVDRVSRVGDPATGRMRQAAGEGPTWPATPAGTSKRREGGP